MKDYRKEEEIVKEYTSSKNTDEIYKMTFNCAEVVELMNIAELNKKTMNLQVEFNNYT